MKVLLFTHESDIDGLGNVVLAKMAFQDVDVVLATNIEDLEPKFRKKIEDGVESYDKIFVTDLALYDPALTLVANSPELRCKTLIFDHHAMAIKDGMGRYDFTTIKEDDDGILTCGTELFYKYLTEEGYLTRTSALDDFVELTRLEDTWAWKSMGKRGELAHSLATLLNAVGIENYIDAMFIHVNSGADMIVLTDSESETIRLKNEEYKARLAEIMASSECFIDEFGNKYITVFADYEYRGELAEYIKDVYANQGIKYFVMVALEKGIAGQKSYRSIDPDFDVNEIAMAHGGGGHPGAASVMITPSQKEKALTLERRESLKYLVDSKNTDK